MYNVTSVENCVARIKSIKNAVYVKTSLIRNAQISPRANFHVSMTHKGKICLHALSVLLIPPHL